MKGKERKGKERKGKERTGKERKGKERKGKERKGMVAMHKKSQKWYISRREASKVVENAGLKPTGLCHKELT
jgi:hypothetical protein